MKLSVIIPSYNEAENILSTIDCLIIKLTENNLDFEILVINDNSTDDTESILKDLQLKHEQVRYLNNKYPNGFGYAVRFGLENYTGDCVAIFMADLSDDPEDLIKFYNKMISNNLDCVFGSRFIKGGATYDYPAFKYILNRLFNTLVKFSFRIKYNDTTNAFKLYKRETINGLKPFLSPHFNLTLELPLKAIVRGYNYEVIPNKWTNRKFGVSKLKIREMGSRYFFILLYCLIEKFFAKGDFKKR